MKRFYQAKAIAAAILKYGNKKGLLYFSTIREAHAFEAVARQFPGLPNKVPSQSLYFPRLCIISPY